MTRRTVAEVYDAVLDTKSEVVGVRGEIVKLREHVNHQVELLTARIDKQDTAIDGKLDSGQLLTFLGFRLLNHKAVRWIVGIVATTTIGTIAAREWLGPFWSDTLHRVFNGL